MRIRAVLFICILTVCRTAAFSESSGAVLGRVLESANQAAVANATVTARNESGDFETTAVTAEDGTFFVSSLPPGFYTIRVNREGFQQNSISGYPVRLSGTAADAPARIRLARNGAGQAGTNVNPSPTRLQGIRAPMNRCWNSVSAGQPMQVFVPRIIRARHNH
jgi:hypothetical protein